MKIKDLFKKVAVANEVVEGYDEKFAVGFNYGYVERVFDNHREFVEFVNSEFNEPWAKVLRSNFDVDKNIEGSYDFSELIIDKDLNVVDRMICKFTFVKKF